MEERTSIAMAIKGPFFRQSASGPGRVNLARTSGGVRLIKEAAAAGKGAVGWRDEPRRLNKL